MSKFLRMGVMDGFRCKALLFTIHPQMRHLVVETNVATFRKTCLLCSTSGLALHLQMSFAVYQKTLKVVVQIGKFRSQSTSKGIGKSVTC